MTQKWVFWLIRIVIYMGVATFLILMYNQNNVNSNTRETIFLIGKIFGVTIVLFELVLVLRNAVRRKNEE